MTKLESACSSSLSGQRAVAQVIINRVRDRTGGKIAIESAALYQALHRLEKRQFVRAWWGVSDNNRRAKFYQLTPAGRKQLRDQSGELKEYVAALYAVLDPA